MSTKVVKSNVRDWGKLSSSLPSDCKFLKIKIIKIFFKK